MLSGASEARLAWRGWDGGTALCETVRRTTVAFLSSQRLKDMGASRRTAQPRGPQLSVESHVAARPARGRSQQGTCLLMSYRKPPHNARIQTNTDALDCTPQLLALGIDTRRADHMRPLYSPCPKPNSTKSIEPLGDTRAQMGRTRRHSRRRENRQRCSELLIHNCGT